MNRKNLLQAVILFLVGVFITSSYAKGQHPGVDPLKKTADLEIEMSRVTYSKDLDLLIFEQHMRGQAGNTVPLAKGALDGAPVLGYVFPTTLSATDVGFSQTQGIVALAVTSHPDFDDTPLWDEDQDQNFENDGVVYHTHWVVLTEDDRVPGGLAVKEIEKEDTSVVLPPTNPGMPMYLDSPGFSVVLQGNTLKVLVPAARVNGKTDFNYDAVTVYMEVNTSDEKRPLLGVYQVYSVLSGDLSLPYTASR